LMSGTPCPNRPEELFVPMHVIRPTIVNTFGWFAQRYCDAKKTRFSNFDTRGSSRKKELAWLLKRAYMMRFTKSEVMGEMPPKTCSRVHITSGDNSTLDKLAEVYEKIEDATPIAVKCLVSEAFRLTCKAKLAPATEFVVEHAKKQATVVFAHHLDMLDSIETAAGDAGLHTARIDGSTPLAKRQAIVNDIQAGIVDLACLSMAAAGVGFTLTEMSHVIFVELPWNPALLHQCEDRVYRVGQKNPCFIQYVVCEETLDDYVWKKIESKERITRAIL